MIIIDSLIGIVRGHYGNYLCAYPHCHDLCRHRCNGLFWAVKSEQFDDLDRQSVSILFDENTDKPNNTETAVTQSSAELDDIAALQAIKKQQKGMPL